MISRADLNFGWIEFPENSIFLTNILSLRSMLIDVCVFVIQRKELRCIKPASTSSPFPLDILWAN